MRILSIVLLVPALAWANPTGAPKAPEKPAASHVSVIRFDASHPDVQAFAAKQGWKRTGYQVTVPSADLVYTPDHWKTTHVAPLQYLYDNRQGFVLRDLPPGAEIEYAVHAQVARSYDHFRSYDAKADFWANNGGSNYVTKTQQAPAPKLLPPR